MGRTFCGREKITHCVLQLGAYEYHLSIVEEMAKKEGNLVKRSFENMRG